MKPATTLIFMLVVGAPTSVYNRVALVGFRGGDETVTQPGRR